MRTLTPVLFALVLLSCSQAPAVERDELEKAAANGDASAQCSLGFIYADGNGVPRDEAKGAEWLQKAALQGNAFAQAGIGVMYAHGRGVPKNEVRAYAWLNLAAVKSVAEAAKTRDMLEKLMTGEQKAEAQKLSAELFAKMPNK